MNQTPLLLPKRIQLRRVKGWKMPPNTVKVTRPGPWGNPYKIGEVFNSVHIHDTQMAVEYYRSWVDKGLMRIKIRNELRGKNLACFCPLDGWCHADVLLEIANR